MTRRSTLATQALLVVLGFGIAAWLYPSLPATIPIHWNARGVPNGFADKQWGAFMLPTVALVAWILSMLRPRFFPGRREVASFRKSYDVTTTATIAFLSAMGVVTLLAAQDESFPVIKAVFVGLGMLLIVVGNFFGKMRRNYFVGIRTPWTLSDGEVWLRTHRFGGKAFVLAGVVTVVGALMDLSALILTAPAVIAAAAAAVYSYVIYARTARMPGSSS